MWDDITCPFPNFNGAAVEVESITIFIPLSAPIQSCDILHMQNIACVYNHWRLIVNISKKLFWTCDYLSTMGLKWIHDSKIGPWYRQVTINNPIQCWPRYSEPYSVTGPYSISPSPKMEPVHFCRTRLNQKSSEVFFALPYLHFEEKPIKFKYKAEIFMENRLKKYPFQTNT